MPSNSEYIEPIANDSPATSSPDDEIDSLPDSAPSDDIDNDEEEEESDAEKEWKESLQQLELILTMVLVPYAGKYFGRKCAYWGWAKFMEWKYPVEVVYTSKRTFQATGAVAVGASL
ncbi:hypothetical protein JMJ35_000691 [Cladonia borealis]|uniref:Uncharacterized protein n=1 Tax=Cladonia borealis TaxID=184061 RepID=A0AA39RBK1_9LECA|nr:hypothetical protein JMJ35_000691 [Cladonia borealis]